MRTFFRSCFFFLIAPMLAGMFFAAPALAGSCNCAGSYTEFFDEYSATVPVKQLCAQSNDSAANSVSEPFTSQADCDSFAASGAGIDGAIEPQIICLYSADSSCAAFTISTVSCSTDSDCTQTQGNASCKLTPTGKRYCLFDTLAQQAYLATQHSIVGYKFDLQIKKPLLEITFPGLTFSDVQNTLDSAGYIHLPYIGEFITAMYRYVMAVISIIAVIMIIMAGARIVTSGGGEGKTESYKRIGQVVIGLVIMWGSYFILYTINPSLVNFDVLKVMYIPPIVITDEGVPDTTPIANVDYSGGATLSSNCDLTKLDTYVTQMQTFGLTPGNCLGWLKRALNGACDGKVPDILNHGGAWDVAGDASKRGNWNQCTLNGIKDGDIVLMTSVGGSKYIGVWSNFRTQTINGNQCTVADYANSPTKLDSGTIVPYSSQVFGQPTGVPPVTHIGIYYKGNIYSLLTNPTAWSVPNPATITKSVSDGSPKNWANWKGITIAGPYINNNNQEFIAGYISMGYSGH